MGKEIDMSPHYHGLDTNNALHDAAGIRNYLLEETRKNAEQEGRLRDVWTEGASLLLSHGEEQPKESGAFITNHFDITNNGITSRVRLTGEVTRIYSDRRSSIPVSGTVRLEYVVPQPGEDDVAIPIYEITIDDATGHPSMKDHTRFDEEHEGHSHTKNNIKILKHVMSQMIAAK